MNTTELNDILHGLDTLKGLRAAWEEITNSPSTVRQGDSEQIFNKGDIVTLSFSDEEFIIEDFVNTHDTLLFLLTRKAHDTEKIISSEVIIRK